MRRVTVFRRIKRCRNIWSAIFYRFSQVVAVTAQCAQSGEKQIACCWGPLNCATLKSELPVIAADIGCPPLMIQLRNAALSLDSPDRVAAQVLSGFGGNEDEDKEGASNEAKEDDDEDTSMDDGTGAMTRKGDRQGVVKIVWTAEEDQQLLQVPPQPPVSPLMTTEWKRLWETKTTDAPSVG